MRVRLLFVRMKPSFFFFRILNTEKGKGKFMYRARNLKNRKNCHLLFNGKEGLQFIVIDVETTGLNPTDSYIVELAAIKCEVRNHAAIELERIDIYIKPPMPMPQSVVDIHNITNEFLEDKPNEEAVFEYIRAFFGENPVVAGHNVEFDIDMVNAMYQRNGRVFRTQAVLDTLEMARDLLTSKEVKDYKLETLAEVYGLEAGLAFHNALDDVKATLRVLNVFHDEYQKLPPVTNRQRIYVNSIYYWRGFNKNQQGIYLMTNLGKMYYSTMQKAWFSSEIDLDTIDIDTMEKEILAKMELPSIKEFGKLTEKKFGELKQRLREKKVFL